MTQTGQDGYSFIIPAYNDAAGLQRHLDYFTRHAPQELPVQLVVVDDCSTDDTAEVMAGASLPPHISLTYHRMAENGGPAAARNHGLTMASEARVMFLDADDLLAPCFFDVMRMAPLVGQVDFVMFKYHLSTRADVRFTYDMHRIDRRFFSAGSESTFPMQQYRLSDRPGAAGTVNFPWNKVYRREFLRDAGIRFPDMRMHEDISPNWQSFLRCRTFGVLYWAPPLITHYEIASGDRATQYVGEKRLDIFQELPRIEAEILAHPAARPLLDVFGRFCTDLFNWLTNGQPVTTSPEGLAWQQRYSEAVQGFWEKSSIARPGAEKR